MPTGSIIVVKWIKTGKIVWPVNEKKLSKMKQNYTVLKSLICSYWLTCMHYLHGKISMSYNVYYLLVSFHEPSDQVNSHQLH